MNYKLKPIFGGLITATIINLRGDNTNDPVYNTGNTNLFPSTNISGIVANKIPQVSINDYHIPGVYIFDLLGLTVNTNGVLNWTNGVDNVTLQWKTNSYSDTPNQLYIMERVVQNRILVLIKGGETNYLKGEQLGEVITNWIPVKVEYKK